MTSQDRLTIDLTIVLTTCGPTDQRNPLVTNFGRTKMSAEHIKYIKCMRCYATLCKQSLDGSKFRAHSYSAWESLLSEMTESKCPRALYNMIIYDIKRISTHPLFLMASACLYRDGTACITVQRTKHLSVRFRMLQQRTGITPAVQLA